MNFRVFDIIILVLIFAYLTWFFRRSRSMLEQWANANEYKILRTKRRFAIGGPFFIGTSRAQAIFYVRIYDPARRQIRNTWVRCGGFWSGMSRHQIDVRWDDEEFGQSGSPSEQSSFPLPAGEAHAGVGEVRKPAISDYLGNRWIQVGLMLVVAGWGPLLAVILLDGLGLLPDPDPNPIGPGLLFFFTAWPAIICVVIGALKVRRNAK